ncbi:hypothetical protein SLA2020_473790 [Shorea laevis]
MPNPPRGSWHVARPGCILKKGAVMGFKEGETGEGMAGLLWPLAMRPGLVAWPLALRPGQRPDLGRHAVASGHAARPGCVVWPHGRWPVSASGELPSASTAAACRLGRW